MQLFHHMACFVQAIAKDKPRRMIASIAPFIICFMAVCFFTVKKSMRQADSNGFIHQLINEMDEM